MIHFWFFTDWSTDVCNIYQQVMLKNGSHFIHFKLLPMANCTLWRMMPKNYDEFYYVFSGWDRQLPSCHILLFPQDCWYHLINMKAKSEMGCLEAEQRKFRSFFHQDHQTDKEVIMKPRAAEVLLYEDLKNFY